MRAALAIAVLLLAAPAAHAGSYSIPARGGVETVAAGGLGAVALADGQVVWVEQRGTGAALVAAGEDGVARDVTTLPPVLGTRRFHTVAASGTTALLQRHVCRDGPCERGVTADLIRVDLATGAATRFDGCLGLATCRACADNYGFSFTLRGTVLGISGRCTRKAGVIDLATGETQQMPETIIAAAGPYAAHSPDQDSVIVSDWRTGATITHVRDISLTVGARQVALDADGTVAVAQDEQIRIVAPGAQQPRTIAREPGRGYDIALAGGRLATLTDAAVGDPTFQVDDRTAAGQRSPHGWAFDGTRLAWAAEPCAQPVIQVWDLATDPPPPAGDRCNRARLIPAWQYRVPAGATHTRRLPVKRFTRLPAGTLGWSRASRSTTTTAATRRTPVAACADTTAGNAEAPAP